EKIQLPERLSPLIRLRHLLPAGAGRRALDLESRETRASSGLLESRETERRAPFAPAKRGRRCRRRMRGSLYFFAPHRDLKTSRPRLPGGTMNLQRLSIAHRIRLIMMATSTVVLLLAGIASVVVDFVTLGGIMERDLTTL